MYVYTRLHSIKTLGRAFTAGMANPSREMLLFLMTWLMVGVCCAWQTCSDGSNCCNYAESCNESHDLQYDSYYELTSVSDIYFLGKYILFGLPRAILQHSVV